LFIIVKTDIDTGDQSGYLEIAEYMFGVDGKSYCVPREPFYPFTLGLVFLIFPNTIFTARVFTAVLGSINILIIFFVAKKYAAKFGMINNNEKFGIVASLLVCFNDRLINYDGWALREPLYITLILLLFYSILIEKKIIKRLVFSITSFLLVLTKSESLLLLIGVSILIYFSENKLTNTEISPEIDKKATINVDENKSIKLTRTEENEKTSKDGIKNRFSTYFKKINYNFIYIIIGLVIGFCLWKLLSYLIFSNAFATSDWMASYYFRKEFAIQPPENLSTFDYLFKYHSLKELIIAFFQGITGLLNRYLDIFNILSFPFFILSILRCLFKKDYLSFYWIIYPIIFFGVFAVLWGMGPYDRILLPYSMFGFITMPIFMHKFLEEFGMVKLHKIRISKDVILYLLTSLIVVYSIAQLFANF